MLAEKYRDIDQRLGNPPVPHQLIHYTEFSSLLNIIRSGELWLAQIDKQNDRTEFVHLLALIRDLVPDLKLSLTNSVAQNLIDEAIKDAPKLTFISSWCGLDGYGENSLHWLSYVRRQKGQQL